MTYNPNIPLANDPFDISQVEINTNFTQLNTIFGIDHVAFNALSNQGEHKKVVFNAVLGADPALIYPKAQAYSKAVADGADNFAELFFESTKSTGAGDDIVRQLTGLKATTHAVNGNHWGVSTPWGFILNWGRISTVAIGGTTVGFAIPMTTLHSIVASGHYNDGTKGNITTENETSANFKAYTSNTCAAYYFAIGV